MNGAPEIVIEVNGLTKKFGNRTVVRDLSMRVKRGTIYGFLGPNGSGKTTTIRMLCGLLTPDGGTGTCLGYDIRTEADKIKRHVGYMTQRFSLYQDLSVRENLEFVARLYGLDDARGSARDMIRRLGLDGREEQLAGELSGGWKQRLALGACTLPNPDLLLLDEPTAGVDPKARRDFWNEIHALAAEGLTVLVSTHYMDEAERCHEIAYIAYGELLTHGTVDEVVNHSGLTTVTVRGETSSAFRPNWRATRASIRSRHSVKACTSPAATLRRWRRRSRRIGMPLTNGRPRRPHLRTSSSIWLDARRITTNERVPPLGPELASRQGDGDQGVHPTHARPRLLCHDRRDAAASAPVVRLCHQHYAAGLAHGPAASGEQRYRAENPQSAGEHPVFQGRARLAQR
jgi:ABC-2 type transport system ATP-binding protein